VIVQKSGSLGVRFDNLSMQQEADLVQCTFARADAWTSWKDEQHVDRPLQGLKEIFSLGIVGYRKIFHTLQDNMKAASNSMRLPFARKASE
jgi:cellulose synthase (UDP-forming)